MIQKLNKNEPQFILNSCSQNRCILLTKVLFFACMCTIILQFGIEDLKNEPDQTACWDGVRNYQVIHFIQQCFINIEIEDSPSVRPY